MGFYTSKCSLMNKGWSMWQDVTQRMVSRCPSHQPRSHSKEMDLHENRREFGQLLNTLSQRVAMQMDSWWQTTVEFFPGDFHKSVDSHLLIMLWSPVRSRWPQELRGPSLPSHLQTGSVLNGGITLFATLPTHRNIKWHKTHSHFPRKEKIPFSRENSPY